ncbi:hypothetical protein ACFL59_10150, partial [Planctomycetota bacterium]
PLEVLARNVLHDHVGRAVETKLAKLSAGSQDLRDRETVFTSKDTVAIAGKIEIKGEARSQVVLLRLSNGEVAAHAEPSGGEFELGLAGLQPGQRTAFDLVLTYESAEGEPQDMVLASRTVVCDKRPPTLELQSAEAALLLLDEGTIYLRTKEVLLPLRITEEGGLQDEGVRASIDSPGKVQIVTTGEGTALKLNLGSAVKDPLELKIEATDQALNKAALSYRVIYDATPPALRIESLDEREIPESGLVELTVDTPGAYVANLDVLAARADEVEDMKLEVERPDGERTPFDPAERVTDERGALVARFLIPMDLEGDHLLTVRATDRAGNASEKRATVRLNVRFAVSVALDAMLDGVVREAVAAAPDGSYHTRTAALSVRLEVNKPLRSAVARLGADDQAPETALTLSADGTKAGATLDLGGEGARELVVAIEAQEGGDATSERLMVVYDRTPPTLELLGGTWPEVSGPKFLKSEHPRLKVRVRASDANGLAPLTFLSTTETDAGKARALEQKLAQGQASPESLSQSEVALNEDSLAVLEVPLVDGAHLIVGITGKDFAGNHTRIAARTLIDLRAPRFEIRGKESFKLREPCSIRIGPDEPVAWVRINGSGKGIRRTKEGEYLYEAGPMLLDTVLKLKIEARDLNGNLGVTEHVLTRETVCNNDGTELSSEIIKHYLSNPNIPPLCPGRCGEPILKRGLRGGKK